MCGTGINHCILTDAKDRGVITLNDDSDNFIFSENLERGQSVKFSVKNSAGSRQLLTYNLTNNQVRNDTAKVFFMGYETAADGSISRWWNQTEFWKKDEEDSYPRLLIPPFFPENEYRVWYGAWGNKYFVNVNTQGAAALAATISLLATQLF